MAYNNGLTITCNDMNFELVGNKGESVIKSMRLSNSQWGTN